ATGAIPPERLRGVAALGELSLAGQARPVRGALAAAEALQRRGTRVLIVARGRAREAALARGRMEGVPVEGLAGAVAFVKGERSVAPVQEGLADILSAPEPGAIGERVDLADIQGSFVAKRALLVAAAGGHDLLLMGPPGAGKTMLARRLPGVLPP